MSLGKLKRPDHANEDFYRLDLGNLSLAQDADGRSRTVANILPIRPTEFTIVFLSVPATMEKTKLRNIGRAMLMASVIGLSAGACTTQVGGDRQSARSARQDPQQQQDYEKALAARSAAAATRYIRKYPSSSTSATLLNQLPAGVLSGISRAAVNGLSADVKQRLSGRVKGRFGLATLVHEDNNRGRPGYGG
jgi:hypothetical protein